MTRDEILGLSKMGEMEQIKWLDKKGILECFACQNCDQQRVSESLPDLADRLWRGTVGTIEFDALESCVVDVFKAFGGKNIHNIEIAKDWFMYFSLPIHRIQAALLAKEGA